MELLDALRARRMVRSFDGTAVPRELMTAWCDDALRSPTAGNSAGTGFSILDASLVPDFFLAATDDDWRASAPRSAGLQRAGGVILAWSDPTAYTRRYAETDKARSGLSDTDAWPVPYWHTDAAMATMALLLLITESDYDATIWGAFRGTDELRALASWPAERQLFASILVGKADGLDRPSGSLSRATPRRAARIELLGQIDEVAENRSR